MPDTVAGAIEQVGRDPHFCWDRQRIRDVPVSCICPWSWGQYGLRWVRLSTRLDCPWHTGPSPLPWGWPVEEIRP
jgi:hypothetical protein